MAAMPALAAYKSADGALIASRVLRADDYEARARGLLGRDSMAEGEGLLLSVPFRFVPCPTIHTFFMRFAIDAVFLDERGRVVHLIEDMKPWRLSPWLWRARSCLELPAGAVAGRLKPGDRVELRAP